MPREQRRHSHYSPHNSQENPAAAFGHHFHEYTLRHGITAKAIADHLGFRSSSMISLYFSGKHLPDRTTFQRILEFMGYRWGVSDVIFAYNFSAGYWWPIAYQSIEDWMESLIYQLTTRCVPIESNYVLDFDIDDTHPFFAECQRLRLQCQLLAENYSDASALVLAEYQRIGCKNTQSRLRADCLHGVVRSFLGDFTEAERLLRPVLQASNVLSGTSAECPILSAECLSLFRRHYWLAQVQTVPSAARAWAASDALKTVEHYLTESEGQENYLDYALLGARLSFWAKDRVGCEDYMDELQDERWRDQKLNSIDYFLLCEDFYRELGNDVEANEWGRSAWVEVRNGAAPYYATLLLRREALSTLEEIGRE